MNNSSSQLGTTLTMYSPPPPFAPIQKYQL